MNANEAAFEMIAQLALRAKDDLEDRGIEPHLAAGMWSKGRIERYITEDIDDISDDDLIEMYVAATATAVMNDYSKQPATRMEIPTPSSN